MINNCLQKAWLQNPPRILVCGDVMLDNYIYGDSKRISPEAPVPIVDFECEDWRLGGAGNVAANVSSLGAKVTLLGISGNDADSRKLEHLLVRYSISNAVSSLEQESTIVKSRIIANRQQLLRLDYERKFDLSSSTKVIDDFSRILSNFNLVVLSDYGKGTLRDHQAMITLCNSQGIPVLIDPKGGDFSIYANAFLLTPNLREFEVIVGPTSGLIDIAQKAHKLLLKLNLVYLIVTLGSNGALIVYADGSSMHFEAKAKHVFDVSGAGDTVVSVLAFMVAAGFEIDQALSVANEAAGIVVGEIGTTVISTSEFHRLLDQCHTRS